MTAGELSIAGSRIAYSAEGGEELPALLLLNSLGTDRELWAAQLPALRRAFRVIRYDVRGHGASTASPAPYTIERLGQDALAVLDALGVRRAHLCGISIGGLTAQWLAAHAPERVERVVLCNTAARIGTREVWDARIETVRRDGLGALVDSVLPRWLGDAFRERDPVRVAALRTTFLACSVEGYAGCCAALREADLREVVRGISAPVLVIVGTRDPVTTPADGEALRERIPGARLVALDAAHLSNVEQAAAFNAALLDFLAGASFSADDESRRGTGMAMRRKVLGDAHVDRAIANTTELDAAFQDLAVRYAWGEIWTRPGLDVRARRVLVLGTLVALGRFEEFRMHARAALVEGGFNAAELAEILLQQAIYCGVPAANTGFAELRRVLEELGDPVLARRPKGA